MDPISGSLGTDLYQNYMQVNKNSKNATLTDRNLPGRVSIQASIASKLRQKQVGAKETPRRTSLELYKFRTEYTPTVAYSVSDFWKLQPSATSNSMTFTKINHEQQTIKRYLSKVLINYQTGILQAFRKLRDPSGVPFKTKEVNALNKWYKKAGKILAMNSRINQQKSLWRLRELIQEVEKTSYVKCIDMVIYPQQYVNYEPHYKALLRLENMLRSHDLRTVVSLFASNQRCKRTKRRYLEMVKKNHLEMYRRVLSLLGKLPNNRESQKFYRIKERLKGFLVQYNNRHLREVVEILKEHRTEAKLRRCGAINRILKNTYRNADRVFLNWLAYTKEKRQSLKRKKLTSMFEVMYNKEQDNLGYIFRGFDPHLTKRTQEALSNLMAIEQFYRNQHLLRTFKRWKTKENPWFNRAAHIFSLNTVLNNQTSLWRLKRFSG